MLRGAHIFVATIYTAIGLSFFWTTGTLIQEFWDAEWFTLAALHSHLFLFFPIFGIAALIAFYLPSVVFVDMYWRPGHTRLGRTRFCFGMFVVMTLAIAVSNGLLARQGSMFAPMWHTQAANRQHFIWEVRPEVLRTTDTNEPAGCTGFSDRPCTRTSVLSAT